MRRMICVAVAAGALWVAAVPAAMAGGGGCRTLPQSGSGSTVVMRASCFTPAVLWVDPGATVRFVNEDAIAHHVFGWPSLGLQSPDLRAGMSYEFTFTRAGVYPFACWLHPGMTGVVVAGSPLPSPGAIGTLGSSGEVLSPEETRAAARTAGSSAGAAGGAAALAGGVLGTAGYVIGRRRSQA
ncbi:MAG TPA: hypothetical protein VM841_15350 [Actinomycetota bacterium]|nr:hypothetical protein [Actinomycetota bacterium]